MSRWTRLVALAEYAEKLRADGDLRLAEELQRRVLAELLEFLPPGHPDVLSADGNLAATLSELGEYEEASGRQRRILAECEAVHGYAEPTLTAAANLAVTLYRMGRFTDAEELQRLVLDARSRHLGENAGATLTARLNLAATRYALGDFPAARDLLAGVVSLPADNACACVTYALDDVAAAVDQQRDVVATAKAVYGAEHPVTVMAQSNLGCMLFRLGHLGAAHEVLDSALAVAKQRQSRDETLVGTLSSNISVVRRAMSNSDPAHRDPAHRDPAQPDATAAYA